MVLTLKITVRETEPAVWRRLFVDDSATLHQLHRVIQIAMGWWDQHLYVFEVGGTSYVGPDDEPFTDEEVGEHASRVRLKDLGLQDGDTIDYEYDFGDSWRLEILLEKRGREGERWPLPWVVGGERAGPPEDCGGIPGYERILFLLERGSDHDRGAEEKQEHQELEEWLGDYDPDRFDLEAVNRFLALANRWGLLQD